jgi:protein-disulfide isomerase
VQKLLGDKLRFVFRNFPLAEAHPFATGAAEVAEAAALQDKFWQMHDTLYEHQDELDPASLLGHARALRLDISKLESAVRSTEVTERVRSDFMGGVRSGVNGTPTFFINGERFNGNWTNESELVASIEAMVVPD